MEDNNFRKEVQETLEGLQLQPSEKVWPEVAFRLIKEKRRKRFFFFWLFAALLLSGGIAGYYFVKDKNQTLSSTPPSGKKPAADAGQANTSYYDTGIAIIHSSNTEKETVNPYQKPEAAITAKATVKIKSPLPEAGEDENKKVPKIRYRVNSDTGVKVKRGKDETDNTDKTDIAQTIPAAKKTDQVNRPVFTDTLKADVTPAGDTSSAPVAIIVPLIQPLKKNLMDSTVVGLPKAKAAKTKKPWLISAGVTLGSSRLGNNFLDNLSTQKRLDAPGAGAGLLGGLPIIRFPLPEFKKGSAWEINVTAEKPLSKTFSFISGINFRQFNPILYTGNPPSSAFAGTTYGYGNSVKQINRFSYLCIESGLKTNLLTGKKIKVNIIVAANPGYLVSSKALAYDSSQRIFYYDKASLHTLQFGLNTSLNIDYKLSDKLMLSSGLQFYQSFTPAGSSLIYKDSYFNMWGIKLKYYFNKK